MKFEPVNRWFLSGYPLLKSLSYRLIWISSPNSIQVNIETIHSYLFDVELSFAHSANTSLVTDSVLLVNWFRVWVFLIHTILASLQCAEITSILFHFCCKVLFAAKACASDGYDFLWFILGTTALFFSFNLGVPNPKNGIILCEIKLAIANFNVLFSILLEFILVDVRHYFETVRKHVCKLVLVNN